MNEQEEFEKITRTLAGSDDIPAPNPLRKASARRAYLEYASRLRAKPGVVPVGRKASRLRSLFRLAVAGFGALLLTLSSVTGVVYAANPTQPGDLLYPVDRSMEQLRLRFASSPEQTVQLRLLFADERLAESEQLALEGDEKNLILALDAYSQTISEIAQTVDGAGDQQSALVVLVDDALSIHEERLNAIRADAPEQALLSLEHAIEASHKGHNGEKDGPPRDTPAPDNGPDERDSTPNTQDDKPKHDKPKHDKPKDGKSNGNGPPDGQGPPDNPGQGGD
jgi:hypothetical protein